MSMSRMLVERGSGRRKAGTVSVEDVRALHFVGDIDCVDVEVGRGRARVRGRP